jgi:hypothetical protein
LGNGEKRESGLNVWGTLKNRSKYSSVGSLKVLKELQKNSLKFGSIPSY